LYGRTDGDCRDVSRINGRAELVIRDAAATRRPHDEHIIDRFERLANSLAWVAFDLRSAQAYDRPPLNITASTVDVEPLIARVLHGRRDESAGSLVITGTIAPTECPARPTVAQIVRTV